MISVHLHLPDVGKCEMLGYWEGDLIKDKGGCKL